MKYYPLGFALGFCYLLSISPANSQSPVSDQGWSLFAGFTGSITDGDSHDVKSVGNLIVGHEYSSFWVVIEGETRMFTVKLSELPDKDVTVKILSVSRSPVEYTFSPQSLVFSTGNWNVTQTVTVTAYDDDQYTFDPANPDLRRANILLSPSGSGYGTKQNELIPGNISENDEAEVSLSVSPNPVVEGESVTITAEMSKDPAGDVVIPLTITAGTAETSDYGGLTMSSITILGAESSTTGTIDIKTVADDGVADEAFTVEIDETQLHTDHPGVIAGTPKSVQIIITDNDKTAIPTFTLSASPNPVLEGQSVTITAETSEDPDTDVVVPLLVTAGTAEASDYGSLMTSNITIAGNGSTKTGTMDINTVADNDGLTDETFTVEIDEIQLLTDYPFAVLGNPKSVQVTITDSDQPAGSVGDLVVGHEYDSFWAMTEGETRKFTVKLSEVPGGEVTVKIVSVSRNPVEHTFSPQALVFTTENWSVARTVTVTAYDDDQYTYDPANPDLRRANILLTPSGSGYDTGQNALIPGSISENDVVEVSVSASPNPVLEGNSVTITAEISEDPASDVVIPLTITAGTAEASDYGNLTTSSITIAGNGRTTSGTVDIRTVEDDDGVANETFTVSIDETQLQTDHPGMIAGDPKSVQVIITDSDQPAGSVGDLVVGHEYDSFWAMTEGETRRFTVKLSEVSGGDVTVKIVSVSRSPVEHTFSPQSLVFTTENWSVAQTVTVTAYDDDQYTHDPANPDLRRANILLTPSGSGYGAGQNALIAGSISENDAVEVSLSASPNPVLEGNSVTVTAEISEDPASDVVIPLTITAGTAEASDYRNLTTSSIMIAGNGRTTSGTVDIRTVEDDDGAADETFTVSIDEIQLQTDHPGMIAGDPKSVQVTITDSDQSTVNLLVDPQSINAFSEGTSATFTVKLDKAPSDDVIVMLTQRSSDAVRVDISPEGLTFNTTDKLWSMAKTVTVSLAENDEVDSDEDLRIDLSAAGGGAAEKAVYVDLKFKDNDQRTVKLLVSPNPVHDGEPVTVTVELSAGLDTDVAIPLMVTSGTAEPDDYDSMSPVSLKIGNGQTEIDYTIKTYKDADIEDETFEVTINAENLPSGIKLDSSFSEQVTIIDTDIHAILVPASLEVLEGESVPLDIAFKTQPSNDMTMTITGHEHTDLTPDLTTLNFTPGNYNIAQTVVLMAADDDDMVDDEVILTISASGGGFSVFDSVMVTIKDNMRVAVTEETNSPPFTLWGNYPNPVSGTTKIEFDLSELAEVSVNVTDLLGRSVETLPYEMFGAGRQHTIELNTASLPPGVYYYTLRVNIGAQVAEQRSRAMAVVR